MLQEKCSGTTFNHTLGPTPGLKLTVWWSFLLLLLPPPLLLPSTPAGTLAAHWQAAAMLSSDKPFRCREMIQAGLGAALVKARHELGAYEGNGVVVVTGSLHAVAAGLRQLQLA